MPTKIFIHLIRLEGRGMNGEEEEQREEGEMEEEQLARDGVAFPKLLKTSLNLSLMFDFPDPFYFPRGLNSY